MAIQSYAARTGTTKAVPAAPAAKSQDSDIVSRVKRAKERLEEYQRESSRLAGEKGAVEKQYAELEERCKAEFGCGVEQIPEVAQQMEQAATEAVAAAEAILGIGGS